MNHTERRFLCDVHSFCFFQAKTSGKFSDEELQSLNKEFEHHKDKIHEYNIMVDTVSRTEGEPSATRNTEKRASGSKKANAAESLMNKGSKKNKKT